MLQHQPTWTMKDRPLPNKTQLEILGVIFSQERSASKHLDNRRNNCRKAAFGLNGMEFYYPGSQTLVKAHQWKTICSPTLTYGMEAPSLSSKSLKELDSFQGTLMKMK